MGKWKRKYRGVDTEEAWFIITNLTSLDETIDAYKKRFCIEEMFRDFKKGGYDLERTKLTGHRLTSLIILITLAFSVPTPALADISLAVSLTDKLASGRGCERDGLILNLFYPIISPLRIL